MKKLTLLLMMATLQIAGFGQPMNSVIWNEEAKTNKKLLPKYGHLPKTEFEIKADEKLINEIMKMPQYENNKRAASNHMIELGFKYMYKGDLKTAMYRFNQAYLLDSSNTDIYWGYGAIYMYLGNFELAKKQYIEGLSIDSLNTHLITDYGTYFMSEYYELLEAGHNLSDSIFIRSAFSNLDSAITYLLKSYRLDPKDVNTVYKLSTCYWNKDDCDSAWKYYDECIKLGGQPITKEYT